MGRQGAEHSSASQLISNKAVSECDNVDSVTHNNLNTVLLLLLRENFRNSAASGFSSRHISRNLPFRELKFLFHTAHSRETQPAETTYCIDESFNFPKVSTIITLSHHMDM